MAQRQAIELSIERAKVDSSAVSIESDADRKAVSNSQGRPRRPGCGGAQGKVGKMVLGPHSPPSFPPSLLPSFPPSLARSLLLSLSLSLVNRYIEIYCIRVDRWQAGGGSVKGKGRICILDTQKNICALNNVLKSLSDFVAQRLFLLPALSLLISFLDAFCLFAEFAVTKKRCQEKGITRNKCLKKRAC